MTIKIKHVDGFSTVKASIRIVKREIQLEYKFEGMTYSQTLTFEQSIERGVITKVRANNNFREMTKGKIYRIERYSYSEGSLGCDKGTMLIEINVFGATNISNFEPVIK